SPSRPAPCDLGFRHSPPGQSLGGPPEGPEDLCALQATREEVPRDGLPLFGSRMAAHEAGEGGGCGMDLPIRVRLLGSLGHRRRTVRRSKLQARNSRKTDREGRSFSQWRMPAGGNLSRFVTPWSRLALPFEGPLIFSGGKTMSTDSPIALGDVLATLRAV